MARARNIKPSIMDNEELATLPALTRLLFIYMWMLADREGRLEDRPARIKKQALGYDDGSADEMLNELSRAGFIDRYEVAGAKVIQILAFNKHQTPHIREAASELPCKDASTTKEVPSTSLGSAEALPRSPDTPYLIPDTPYLIPEGESAARKPPAKRATPTPAIAKPDDVDPQTWADWCQLRKAKRATVSLTVIDGARDEAAKAGMSLESFLKIWCRRGSQGLEAEWLKSNERPQAAVQSVESFAERDERRARERIAEATGTAYVPIDRGMVIDITPQRISA